MRAAALRPTNRAVAVAVATLSATVVVSACGSSGSRRPSGYAAMVAFSACMRARGVENFPDPSPGGGFALPSTLNPAAPAYVSAEHSCSRFEPGALPRPKPSEHQKLLAVAFSRCVRGHGFPDFPDPSLSLPAPSSAHGIVRGGMYWALAPNTFASPAFRSAASACGINLGAGVRAPG